MMSGYQNIDKEREHLHVTSEIYISDIRKGQEWQDTVSHMGQSALTVCHLGQNVLEAECMHCHCFSCTTLT